MEVALLEIVLKARDTATAALKKVEGAMASARKSVKSGLAEMTGYAKANELSMYAMGAAGAYAMMQLASHSAMTSLVMAEFGAVLGFIADTILIDILPVIEPFLDALWEFADWYRGAPAPLRAVASGLMAISFAFVVLTPIVKAFGPAFAFSMRLATASLATLRLTYDYALYSAWRFYLSSSVWIAAHKAQLATLGLAAAAAFFVYLAFTAKSDEMKAAFSVLAGVMAVLAARTFIVALATMWNVSAMTLGIGVAAIIAGAVFAASKMWGAKDQAETLAQPKEMEIPEFAEGGIVRRPTFALIGEAGPEAIVPLNGGGLGTNITVNIDLSGATVVDANRMTEIFRQSGQLMADELYRRGVVSRPY